jgi:RNA binding exosome subunit
MTIKTVKVRVFCDEEQEKNDLLRLFPFSLAQEKIKVHEQITTGFADKKIIVYRVILEKQRHIKKFMANLLNSLTDMQQLEISNYRVDEHQQFYLRLDKKAWKQKNIQLTDKGNCYHITFHLVTYPKNTRKAQEEMTNMFK